MASALEVTISFVAPKRIQARAYTSLRSMTSLLKHIDAIQPSKALVRGEAETFSIHRRKKGAIICNATTDSGPTVQSSSQNEWSPESRVAGVGDEVAEENVIAKEKTLRLVESAMLAATAGLAYFLSNLLRIEAYIGCFFPLPVVVSAMRWGPQAGRKTMVSTAMLLMVLSGPLKALSYLLMHGLVGWAMGTLWSWRVNWGLSIAICAVVRSIGALGFVMLSSMMLNENLLQLITINAHASFSYILAAVGVNIVPTMTMVYFVFGILLLLNCGSFVFLLHVLYAIFLRRLGIKTSIAFPRWLFNTMGGSIPQGLLRQSTASSDFSESPCSTLSQVLGGFLARHILPFQYMKLAEFRLSKIWSAQIVPLCIQHVCGYL